MTEFWTKRLRLNYKRERFMIKKGFTLAEVLITLAIIGVIAAITLSNILNNFQKQVYVTQLKKAYTTFNQALLQMTNDAGCIGDLVCAGVMDTNTTVDTFGDEIVKYFNITKNCKTDSSKVCMATPVNENYDGSSSNSVSWLANSGYKFITTDGVSFYLVNYQENCKAKNWSANKTMNMTQVCGEMYIDTNGLKKPNYLGRDVFGFWITNGKGASLYPMGGIDDSGGFGAWCDTSGVARSCMPGSTQAYRCAGRVFDENWQMKY